MKLAKTISIATLGLASALAHAGEDLHAVDFILALEDNKIITGAVNLSDGTVDYPYRIRSAVMGAEGFPNFTNDPGFNAQLGQLNPGMLIGFSILGAPRVWDADAQDFDSILDETITVRAAGQNIDAPSTDMVVEGIVFGQASLDASASFHHHMQYLLDGAQPPAIDGVFLLQIQLWSTSSSITPSDPLFIVFAQGDGEPELDSAIAYVEDNLIGSPCPADLTGDGVLNFFDVSAFLSAFGTGDPAADFSGDGAFNFFDVSAFLSAFAQGCP